MAAPSSLEQLPIEILCLILQHAPDPATLFALIAASPQLFRLFLPPRDQIRVSAVCNQLGNNLFSGLCSVRPPALLSAPGSEASKPPSYHEAMRLRKLDRLVNSLIQKCIDVQFGVNVQLSEVEWFRLRRGMYNYNLAKLSNDRNPNLHASLCRDLSPKEILETMYILHCLRDLAKDHIMRVEDLLVEKIYDGTVFIDWEDLDVIFFGTGGGAIQRCWFMNVPWGQDFQHFSRIALPVDIDSSHEFIFYWERNALQLECDQVLRDQIPSDYRFGDSSFAGIDSNVRPDGARWEFESLFSRFIEAIPSGYMIWDEDRLKHMPWHDKFPVIAPDTKLSWEDERDSVESRVRQLD